MTSQQNSGEIPDQARCPWDTSPSCVLKRRISRCGTWVSVRDGNGHGMTWISLWMWQTTFGDRFFWPKNWEMWLWRLWVFQILIRFGTTIIHIIMNNQDFWGAWLGIGAGCARDMGARLGWSQAIDSPRTFLERGKPEPPRETIQKMVSRLN